MLQGVVPFILDAMYCFKIKGYVPVNFSNIMFGVMFFHVLYD